MKFMNDDIHIKAKDQEYSSGYTKYYPIKLDRPDIPRDLRIYETARLSDSDLVYTMPLKLPGKYLLVLKFFEVKR
jgi:hypothetical protein